MDDKKTTKERIARGAASLFRKQGYAAATLRQIASAIGIKSGSIYYHFDSKQDILFQIMDSTLCELTSIVEEGITKIESPLQKLYAAIDTHIRYHIDNLDYTYAADTEIRSLNEENLKIIIAKRKRYENIFKEIIIEVTTNSTTRIINTKLTTLALLQMCTGLSLWFQKDGELSIQDVIDQYYQFVMSGISDNEK